MDSITSNNIYSEQPLSINALLAPIPGLVFYKTVDSIYTAASGFAARLCGFQDADQLSGHNDYELRCPATESADDFRAEDQKAVKMAKEISCLQVNQYADGKMHIFLVNKAPIFDANGKVRGVCIIGNEVSNPIIGQAIVKLITLGDTNVRKKSFINTNFEINANEAFSQLSNRESELIFYFIRGFSNKEIGTFMNISPRTVESYLDTIKSKYKCATRNDLLLFCLHQGFSYIIPQSLLQGCLNKSITW